MRARSCQARLSSPREHWGVGEPGGLVHLPPSHANYTFWQRKQPGAVSFASLSLFSAFRCQIITGLEGKAALGVAGGGEGCLHLEYRFCQPLPLMTPASARPVSTHGNERAPLRGARCQQTVTPSNPPPAPPSPPHRRQGFTQQTPGAGMPQKTPWQPCPCPVQAQPAPSQPCLGPPARMGTARLQPFSACKWLCFAEPIRVVQTNALVTPASGVPDH